MLKQTLRYTALLILAFFISSAAIAEEDASMHQVYQAAEAGKFKEAQAMMDKVLRDHPNSAKAHFVEAELLAKQGLLSNASTELNTAERLQPGLTFVKPETLQNLKNRIASASSGVTPAIAAQQNLPFNAKDLMPIILMVLGMGLLIVFIVSLLRRNSNKLPINYPGNVPGSNIPPAGGGMGQTAPGNMGSGIMGNLATGAAMGAGVVAGEALMHHFIDGDKNNHVQEPTWITATNTRNDDDMGGTDFGVADASSWDDDNSADGGDDWT